MSEYGHCCDCGGSDGQHYSGCTYEGTDDGYSSYPKRQGTGFSAGKWWIGYIIALIIGFGISEFLGSIIIIGLIFWLLVN